MSDNTEHQQAVAKGQGTTLRLGGWPRSRKSLIVKPRELKNIIENIKPGSTEMAFSEKRQLAGSCKRGKKKNFCFHKIWSSFLTGFENASSSERLCFRNWLAVPTQANKCQKVFSKTPCYDDTFESTG